jgi:glycosyltransferase involved in cell wall biosynthesis
MYRDHVIAAVVPAHNEQAHIAWVITSMPAYVDHIVVVDDASIDDTSRNARATGDPRLILIRHHCNTGVGGAVVDGHRRALAMGADIAVVMAGDGQMDPEYLPSLLDPIVDGRCDMAKANRFFSSRSFDGMPRYRIAGNVLLSFLNKVASGYWDLFDPQNGYVAIRREALEAISLEGISPGYSLENDVLISLNIVGARVADVPIPARYGTEVSGIRLRRVVPQMTSLLVRGFLRRIVRKYVLWSFSPVALFLFGGMVLAALGSAIGLWATVVSLGPPTASPAAVLAAVAPLLLGINMLMAGLLLDIQEGRRLQVHLDPFGGHITRQRVKRDCAERRQAMVSS